MRLPSQDPVAFVDSSALVALADSGDLTHQAAVEAYRTLLADHYCLFTTNHVVDETFGLLAAGPGFEAARSWLARMAIEVYVVDAQDESRARKLLSEDRDPGPKTYTDATSYVVMERLGITDAFAVDPDFLAGLS
jgi:uncharacterized protein